MSVRVVLVSMPFASAASPSLGLGLLASVLREAGHRVRVHYATLPFSQLLGPAKYDRIAYADAHHLVGDWVFADDARANARAADATYIASILRENYASVDVAAILEARALAPAFTVEAAAAILRHDPHVVGFTSTFAQTAASLAVARVIKRERPDIPTVFGGANCEGSMGAELVRRFACVDAVVSGEAENVIAELVVRLHERRSIARLGGVLSAATSVVPAAARAESVNLEKLPYPDFDDFFALLEQSGGEAARAQLPFEASRGCWWGEKHHCIFCGLNGSTIGFRSKSAARFIAEIAYLAERYDAAFLSATDNILDYRYFKTALPLLARRQIPIGLFFEIKANLRRADVVSLKSAGVRWIQPGIESLDSGILRLMRKGVTMLQNVQLLKLCKEYGIAVSWNMLYGFPNEEAQAYSRMARVVTMLTHLTPPAAVGPVRLDRFSPMFERSDEFSLADVRPAFAYECVYGRSVADLRAFAYYFDFAYSDGRDVASYAGPMVQAVNVWRSVHETAELFSVDGGHALLIVDRRPTARHPVAIFSEPARSIFLGCDEIRDSRSLAAELLIDEDVVRVQLDRFVTAGLMLAENGLYLGLAVRSETGGMSPTMKRRLDVAQRLLARNLA